MKRFVIVIKEEPSGKVRIGQSEKRTPSMASRQTWNPDKLSLQKSLTREYQTEDEAEDIKECVHAELKNKGLHIRGSWYRPQALGMLPGIFDDCE